MVALAGTAIEPDLEEGNMGTVSLFIATDRIEREALDDNEIAQRRLQREQDGSGQVRRRTPNALTAQPRPLLERRNAFELMPRPRPPSTSSATPTRSCARTGSMVAIPTSPPLIDGQISRREALAQTRCSAAESEGRLHRRSRFQRSPPDLGGARSGPRPKHPGMVLLTVGSRKGARLITAKWTRHTAKVPQVAFRPDWITQQGRTFSAQRRDQLDA